MTMGKECDTMLLIVAEIAVVVVAAVVVVVVEDDDDDLLEEYGRVVLEMLNTSHCYRSTETSMSKRHVDITCVERTFLHTDGY
jgi:hypothetical protein